MLVGPTTLPNVFRPQPSSKTRAQHHVWFPPPFKALSVSSSSRGGGEAGSCPTPIAGRVPGPDPHARGRGKSLPIKQHRAYGLGGVHKNACGCVSARVVSKYLHVPLNKYGLKSGLGREKRVPGTFGAFQSRAGGSRPPGALLQPSSGCPGSRSPQPTVASTVGFESRRCHPPPARELRQAT